ncbi:MAG: hypothetical protein K6E68_06540 [Lachnospiraceae bacterium]|nr:hypothetical protein [Lachnospiraceae bacterium]
MISDGMTADQILQMYRDDVNKLAAFLPYLQSKQGDRVSSIYADDGLQEHSVAVPVYDGNLMSFIKTADATSFMDRNYRYVYTRNRLRSAEDELAFIEKATIFQMDMMGGILSNYVLGGRTKARLWSEGVRNGVFYKLVDKMKELVDFWTNAERKEI